jgi:hypothetical protein
MPLFAPVTSAIVCRSTTSIVRLRTHLGEDLATVPIVDAPRVTTVIAWPPHSRSLAVAGLVRAAGRL